jgi:hypothetical protein
MKKFIQESFTQLVANRYLLVLNSSMIFLALCFAIYVALNVHPSELQLVSHYSDFGITHFYRNQWYYLLSFGAFGILSALMNTVLSVKLLINKDSSLAILYTWLSIAVIALAWMTTYAVLNVWSPS